MSMRKRLLTGAVGTFMAASSAVVLAGPAHAAIGDCPSTYLCAWANTDYNSARLTIRESNSDFGKFAQSACTKYGTWNDCASSLYNHTSDRCYRLYATAGWVGGYHTLSSGDVVANLGTAWAYNDVISSDLAIATTGGC